MKLTIYHNGQFWVGVIEECVGFELSAIRFVFGTEPHDADVLDFLDRTIKTLLTKDPKTVTVKAFNERAVNPKRLARIAAREIKAHGISTKAQEALKVQFESNKQERLSAGRQMEEASQSRKREIAIQKAKQKHRGK
jgi:hypothetical protein